MEDGLPFRLLLLWLSGDGLDLRSEVHRLRWQWILFEGSGLGISYRADLQSLKYTPNPRVQPELRESKPRSPLSLAKPFTWEFPKIRGTLFWGPYNKDPTIRGTI